MLSFDHWLSVILLIGVCLTIVILIVLYIQGVFRRRIHYKIFNFPSTDAPNFALTIASLSDSFINNAEVIKFWVKADEIQPARLNAIRNAQHRILFETYIMTPGERANAFATALIEKANAGVTVQVIVDSYGAKSVPERYWKNLEIHGIEIRFFNPFSWRSPYDYLQRSHRKLLLIDDQIALIGGAGMSDYWDGIPEQGDRAPWFDFEVQFEGSVVERLHGLFIQHWLDSGKTIDLSQNPLPQETSIQQLQTSQPTVLVTSGEDPSYRDSSIRALYQTLIMAAQSRIWIASPYFLPFSNIQKLLIEAKHRGVDVRILTMGSKTDKPFVHYSARELYKNLLREGIEIYEYQPSMMHGKTLLIDNGWVSLGSANFDPRSFWSNDELNLSTSQPFLCQNIENFLLNGFSESQCISYQEWKHRPLIQKIRGKVMLLFYLLL
ncbi:phosphatidylserine/phosphatidylglycerophosphate/cardiolipin synthase family protein [Lyngbya sp. PCC 8106]|uniref:phospholipase D-like domain-containing protein n=1 Tax=Lyngbya sp. (strain PCC 8106) TaxID=313612 RepID=UPI0000EADA06|nr:cardiolipin synthase B [Lyngbya sp. PCC 8106]EAW33546.1 cardiolipin synthetase [Lyngbya sp. PCC 8106]